MRSLCPNFVRLVLLQLVPALLWAQTSPPNGEEGPNISQFVSPCRIETILPRMASQAKEFVENVNRFTATEVLERERLDGKGKLKDKVSGSTHFVTTIRQMGTGIPTVEEYRDETRLRSFDGAIEAIGISALVLIFHPSHFEEFDMTCEGPADWHAHRTWRVRFQQRLDKPATMTSLSVGSSYFRILLKGSAWIDRDTYQLLHIEVDLLEPIPAIGLNLLHQSVDYEPVTFFKNERTLWLPRRADVTADFKARRLVERHTYKEFRLFWVDTTQKIGEPMILLSN